MASLPNIKLIKVWCLLLDHDHKPTFGEPFPVFLYPHDTIHDLKIALTKRCDKLPHVSPNDIEIWKCKSPELSAKDSFGKTKKQIGDFKFDDDENSDVEHLGAARTVMGIGLEDGEPLIALVPRAD